ncbi:MAG TPA: hypothetical protein VGG16_28670 [Streptosporangiaceae bacterium]|jgi:hypothetical protein
MADYTKSGGISTAKARRKDSAARNKALGLATRGRDKRGQPEAEPQDVDLAALVPEARQAKAKAKPRQYKMLEHRRRDTGAVIWALDLTAPDAPDKRVAPVTNDHDVVLEYAAVCVTHDSPPAHFATAPQARREAKWSHKWCEDCRGDQARTPATRSKARRNS